MRKFARASYYGHDADFAMYMAQQAKVGATLLPNTANEWLKFIQRAKSNGYFSKITLIAPEIGNSLAACFVYLRPGFGAGSFTNFNFVSGDYTELTCLKGDAATKYLDAGVPTANLVQTINSAHLMVYNKSIDPNNNPVSAGSGPAISGGFVTSTYEFDLYAPYIDNTLYFDCFDGTYFASGTATDTPFGIIIGSRVNATDLRLYENAVQKGVTQTTSVQGAMPTQNLQLYGEAGAGYCGYALGGGSIGYGLVAAEVSAYTADYAAFNTNIGR